MRLNLKFIIYVALVESVLIILSVYFLLNDTVLLIAAETIIVISLILAVKLYKALIQPVKLLTTRTETLKEGDFSSKLVYVGQKEMDQLIEVYNRMIERLREERIITEEQNFFLEKLIQAAPSGIIILDLDNRITAINSAASKILSVKLQQIQGMRLNELEGYFYNELALLYDGEIKTINISGAKIYKIQKAHFIDRGYKRGFIIIEELTEEVRSAEKHSYGKIIRTMSHEINNSIGAINSILNSFLTYSPQLKGEDKADFVNAINVAVERNVKLNRFMSNFADVVRLPLPVKAKYSLNKLIEDTALLMHSICKENSIEIKLNLCPGEMNLLLDAQQFEQVLVNIIKNSVESIGKGGIIEIETKCGEVKSLSIRDNGKGIPAEIKGFLFTPFFSSKINGQGIGLTLIREILSSHNCTFTLETRSDDITEFLIIFNNQN